MGLKKLMRFPVHKSGAFFPIAHYSHDNPKCPNAIFWWKATDTLQSKALIKTIRHVTYWRSHPGMSGHSILTTLSLSPTEEGVSRSEMEAKIATMSDIQHIRPEESLRLVQPTCEFVMECESREDEIVHMVDDLPHYDCTAETMNDYRYLLTRAGRERDSDVTSWDLSSDCSSIMQHSLSIYEQFGHAIN